jgi:hypothetical protein
MKKIRIPFFFLCSLVVCQSLQAQTLADLFIKMPNTLLPGITEDTRKDLVDFQKNSMKAVMPAAFGGKVELNTLTDDYLVLSTSVQGNIQLKLLPVEGSEKVIVLLSTMGKELKDTRMQVFNLQWKPVPGILLPVLHTTDFVNDSLARQNGFSNILSRLPARLFVAFSCEPNTNYLYAVSSLKNDLSVEQRGSIESYLQDTLKFEWRNGKFEQVR